MNPDISRTQPTDIELNLTPECEEAFSRVIGERTGIVVQDSQLMFLRASVRDACRKFNYASAQDYLSALQRCGETSRELEHLIADITVGESYFFRDAEQIQYLSDVYLPALIGRKRRARFQMLRIWSAGCSMGQELYTIAILLEELLPDIDRWTIHLLGTDINTAALRQAVTGRYVQWSLRSVTAQKKSRYFKRPRGDDYELLPRIRRRARFIYQNLSEDNFPSILSETNAQDLILCRNVLMYMGSETVASIMMKFAASLVPDGVLLLGACDPHVGPIPGLIAKRSGNVHYYVPAAKTGNESTIAETTRPSTRARASPALRPSAGRTGLSLPARRVPRRETVTTATSSEEPLSDRQPGGPAYPNVKALLGDQRWSDAVRAIEDVVESEGESPFLLQLKAKALANLGDLHEAVELCGLSQAGDPGDKHSYLIQAMALQGLNRLPEAETVLRKALYLDHEFVEVHYQLALLLFVTGRMPAGLKSLENALQIAARGDPERAIHDAPGITYGRFVEILQNEFDIYSGLTDRK